MSHRVSEHGGAESGDSAHYILFLKGLSRSLCALWDFSFAVISSSYLTPSVCAVYGDALEVLKSFFSFLASRRQRRSQFPAGESSSVMFSTRMVRELHCSAFMMCETIILHLLCRFSAFLICVSSSHEANVTCFGFRFISYVSFRRKAGFIFTFEEATIYLWMAAGVTPSWLIEGNNIKKLKRSNYPSNIQIINHHRSLSQRLI